MNSRSRKPWLAYVKPQMIQEETPRKNPVRADAEVNGWRVASQSGRRQILFELETTLKKLPAAPNYLERIAKNIAKISKDIGLLGNLYRL